LEIISQIKNTTFTGREWGPETELYYYRARYYDPGTGRFLQSDPEPGKIMNPLGVINKYIYASNSPVMNIDPTGKDFLSSLGQAIFGGSAVSLLGFGVLGAFDAQQHGGNPIAGYLNASLVGVLYAAAFVINPAGAALGLGLALAQASASGEDVLHTFLAHGVQSGALALVGAAAVSDANYLVNFPFIGPVFTPVLTAVTVGGYIGLGSSLYGLYSSECDPSKNDLRTSNPNLCPAN